MDIVSVYTDILDYVSIKIDSRGFLLKPDDSPVMLNKKPVALPLPEMLRGSSADRVIFHPLMEEVNKGESEILLMLKHYINIRLNFIFSSIALNLLKIAVSPDIQAELGVNGTNEHLDVMVSLKNADHKTVVTFAELMKRALDNNAPNAFVNIYLKRGGYVREKRYSRAGIVTCSLLESLDKNEHLIHTVKIRKADIPIFKSLYDVILPDSKLDTYNRGSNTYVAPFLDSLLQTSKAITDQYNRILDVFGTVIERSVFLRL